jgi:hypothetical protein
LSVLRLTLRSAVLWLLARLAVLLLRLLRSAELLSGRLVLRAARGAPRGRGTGGRRAAGRRVRGLRSPELLLRLAVRLLAELRGLLSRLAELGLSLRRAVLRLLPRLLAELRLLARLLAELRLLARLLAELPLLRSAELRLPAVLRVLTRLAELRLLSGLGVRLLPLRRAELRRLARLLAELPLLRSAELRLLARLLPELRLARLRGLPLRRAELRVLRCARPLAAGTPGQPGRLGGVRRVARAGPARLLTAHRRDRPLGRLGLGGGLRGGRFRRRRGARVLAAHRRDRPLGRLGLRHGVRRRSVGLCVTGLGRGVGHGSADYPTNRGRVTPGPYLSSDRGVGDPRVHLA